MELMIAVAILGILAGALVYSLNKPTRKVKTGSEANAMFAELHRVQSQYALENGVYLSTGADEGDLFPATPSPRPQDLGTLPDEWLTLKVKPTASQLMCGYVTVAGTRDDDIPAFAADFGMEQPVTNWYVLFARCDGDGDDSRDATYFASSVDQTVQRRDEGY